MNAYSTIAAAGIALPTDGEPLTTLADVAAFAGVSAMTVSRVVNGGSVKDSTRLKVQRALKTLGYRPNEAARALSYRRARG